MIHPYIQTLRGCLKKKKDKVLFVLISKIFLLNEKKQDYSAE